MLVNEVKTLNYVSDFEKGYEITDEMSSKEIQNILNKKYDEVEMRITLYDNYYTLITDLYKEVKHKIHSIKKTLHEHKKEAVSLSHTIQEQKNQYHYKDPKEKWEITTDVMMIIGKYFESNKDYVNVMKTSKRYHDLTQMYHFNPIQDPSLFINIETQHLYDKEDIKKEGMHHYVYWYNAVEVTKELQNNESIKLGDPYKYVEHNISKLEEWCGYQMNSVLYDSERDGKDGSTFRQKILHHDKLYFIVIDSENNVFGHYHPTLIEQADTQYISNGIFIFTLNSNGRSEVRRYTSTSEQTYTYIWSDNDYYKCNYDYMINSIGYKKSYISTSIRDTFNNITINTLTGQPNYFITTRIVIIQMK